MLPKITELPRVKKELKTFQESISEIGNPHIRKRAQTLYKELEKELQLIENGHAAELDGNIRPEDLRDNIIKSVQLRRELQKYIKNSR